MPSPRPKPYKSPRTQANAASMMTFQGEVNRRCTKPNGAESRHLPGKAMRIHRRTNTPAVNHKGMLGLSSSGANVKPRLGPPFAGSNPTLKKPLCHRCRQSSHTSSKQLCRSVRTPTATFNVHRARVWWVGHAVGHSPPSIQAEPSSRLVVWPWGGASLRQCGHVCATAAVAPNQRLRIWPKMPRITPAKKREGTTRPTHPSERMDTAADARKAHTKLDASDIQGGGKAKLDIGGRTALCRQKAPIITRSHPPLRREGTGNAFAQAGWEQNHRDPRTTATTTGRPIAEGM